jgi:tRNA threonylcarbamoyladenosine biosynthesis protein TsaE
VSSHSPLFDVEVRAADLAKTRELGVLFAAHLRPGDVICLEGELGAGKTTFVGAVAAALGVEEEVVSPTFTLENRYALRPRRPQDPSWLVHYDLYRPGEDARRDLLPAMLEAREERAVLAIEWAGPVKDWLTPYLEFRFVVDRADPRARRISLRAVPAGWPAMGALDAAWKRSCSEENPQ